MRLNYDSYKHILFDCVEPDVDLACLPPLLSKAARGPKQAQQYFEDDIVPRLTKEHERIEYMLGRFSELIYEDESIPEKQKDALWALAYDHPLPEFLAETFLYAIKRVVRPEEYDAAPDRNAKVIAFPGQRGAVQSSALMFCLALFPFGLAHIFKLALFWKSDAPWLASGAWPLPRHNCGIKSALPS